MRLQSLELSGFKSFAKKTALQFPSPITAIVGPNGAGKSNIAEAVRWVLGEQSLKSLRGKRGEDLIFHGSASSPRTGKASVTLTFNNRDGTIPIDFESVTIGRKIFRDGTNDYLLNGSVVRLKDIVLLLARMGLGETKHNMVNQGDVDRFLAAGSRERREFLEEALGLKLWQLKKREAERKLEETGANARQVEALVREIKPHLKFLKSQADKAERREAVGHELEAHYRALAQREAAAIARETEGLERQSFPLTAGLERLEKEIATLNRDIAGDGGGWNRTDPLKARERELETGERQHRELSRELGRIEGRLEHPREGGGDRSGRVAVASIRERLEPIVEELKGSLSSDGIGELKRRVEAVIKKFEAFMADVGGLAGVSADTGTQALEAERRRIQAELERLVESLDQGRREISQSIQAARRNQEELRERFERLREREKEANQLRVELERLGFEREKLALRRQELKRVIGESGFEFEELETGETPYRDLGTDELRKKIEKLKVRLEEIGGIDPAVLGEYQETKSRHDFLEGELNDLTAAAKDLGTLTAELTARIEHDFQKGFRRVNEEFHRYFKIIFGGGRGTLISSPLESARRAESGETETTAEAGETETGYGIDIAVDLPRKRIKGLAMLSGGERALVSIALLFAITAVNPPPFLVLDETDAALDEANSAKYASILEELAKKTQLILITHNRATMERAGILYGVTMGDDGISKLLSLKLEEAESYGEAAPARRA